MNYEYYHKQTKVVAVITIFSSLLNVGLNWFLIQSLGMVGAALATALSHSVQLILHHLYCALWLGRGDYPFPAKLWMVYPVLFGIIVAAVYLTGDLWLPRWGFGAVLGIWELLRIKKRHVLI